jgi:photosystem II stability/assembly factor-like uncharacterized protein
MWPAGGSIAWTWTEHRAAGLGAQGIERTTDGGSRWSDVTPRGLAEQGGKHFINGFFALNAHDAWLAYGGLSETDRQTVLATTDGGRRWTVVGHQPHGDACNLEFVSRRVGWCAGIGAGAGSEVVQLYRTTDDAASWRIASRTWVGTNPPASLPFGGDKNIAFTTKRVGWATFHVAGRMAPLYGTVNGGKSWTAEHVVTAPGNLDDGGSGFTGQPVLDGRNGAVGYTVDSARGTIVYVTTDGGRNWHAVIPPGRGQPWLVDTLTPQRWRLVNRSRILLTDNAGRTWRTITTNHSFSLFYPYDSPTPPVVDFATSKVAWIQDLADFTLWRTTNGGSHWQRVTIPGT